MLLEQVTTTQQENKEQGPRMSFSKQSNAFRCPHGYQSIKHGVKNKEYSQIYRD